MRSGAHIAIITAPIASMINPLLPVIATLARRGHGVSCAVSDPFAERVEAAGAHIVKYRHGVLSGHGQDAHTFCRLAINTLAGATPFYETNRPDLILYDLVSFAGPILAQRWHVPVVRISPFYTFTRETLGQQIEDPVRCERALEANARIDQFLQQHGVLSTDFLFRREQLNVHMMPRDFDPGAAAADDSCLYAGRCAGEQPAFGAWRPPAARDGPLVLVATSKSHVQGPDYFRTCIAALGDLNWHVVLSIDDEADAAQLRPLPAQFEIVQKTSHTRILPHASLLVFMGGLTAANEAAYHGVPFVITSMGVGELEWLGGNLDRLGVGVHLSGAELHPSTLRQAAAHTLRSAAILDSARSLQFRVRREPGGEEVANRIEECLDRRV